MVIDPVVRDLQVAWIFEVVRAGQVMVNLQVVRAVMMCCGLVDGLLCGDDDRESRRMCGAAD